MKFTLSTITALLLTTTVATAAKRPQTMPKGILSELPDTGEEWKSMKNGIEFQPAKDLSPLAQYHLRKLVEGDDEEAAEGDDSGDGVTTSNAFDKIFVDGSETYYNDYAQAWRALGWYIDCDYCDPNYGCSAAGGDASDQDGYDRSGCRRFLLWAAYVDENYEGNGVYEYSYFNRNTNRWNDVACKAGDTTRCAKMDCHLPNTHFSLLGFFKEPNYDEWMEQLFKHEGDCLWNDDEYKFMQKNREAWPTGCTESIYTDNGNTIYYDLKPEPYGSMSIGLYTDGLCVQDYKGRMTAEKVLRGMVCGGHVDGGDDTERMCNNETVAEEEHRDNNNRGDNQYGSSDIWSLERDIQTWNDAFDVYKICQPCKAYDLSNIHGYSYNQDGDRYENNRQGNNNNGDDDSYEFHCYDDADYDNVNQCMKFATHTYLWAASWRDVELAGNQGSITGISLSSANHDYLSNSKRTYYFGKSLGNRNADVVKTVFAWIALVLSAAAFGWAVFSYKRAKEDYNGAFGTSQEPLVSQGVNA